MTEDAQIREILRNTKVIAMVGASLNPARASHGVMRFLISKGKRVIPVNPGHAGEMLHGSKIYASLKDIPKEFAVDMVDIFRNSDAVLPIVERALVDLPVLRTIWLQLGVESPAGADLARAHDVVMVQNRCPAIEWPRLGL